MPARFTNLRPAEAKPVDRLRALHTPLYAQGEASAFRDSIINAGLPAGVALAAARIANPDFVARAELVSRGDLNVPQASSVPGGPRFVELARWLARADNKEVMRDVARGELRTDLASLILATKGIAPNAPGTIIQDDLLSLYLVPGALPDYRRILGALHLITRLVRDNGKGLDALLLPSPGAVTDDLHGPWPDNRVPLAWRKIAEGGKILLPAQIAVRAPAPGSATHGSGGLGHVLADSSFTASDFTQFAELAATSTPQAAAATETRTAEKTKPPRL